MKLMVPRCSRDIGRVEGGSTFTLSGPEVDGALAADCGFYEQDVDFALTAKPRRLRYECTFTRDGRPIDARLTLSNPEPTRDARAGMLEFEGQQIAIRSIHALAGAKVPTTYPLGYLFDAGGQTVGGVDLSNTARPQVLAPHEAKLRQATMVAALALSTFPDPAQDIEREEGLIVGRSGR